MLRLTEKEEGEEERTPLDGQQFEVWLLIP